MNSILKAVNKGKGTKVKIEARYENLSSDRNTYLAKAQTYARFTLPNTYPCEVSGSTETQHGFDSTGAKATNHLVNKMVMTLFPSHLPFFKIDFSEKAKLKLTQDNVDITALKEIVSVATDQAHKLQAGKASRVAAIEALKQLVIGGNTLWHTPKGKKNQAIPLDNYVVERDTYGDFIEVITKQTKSLNTYPEEIQAQLIKAMKQRGISKEEEDISLYTWIYRQDAKSFVVAQSALDILLLDKQVVLNDDLPWVPLTWNLAYGRDYGNGHVEDYSGDFYAAEFLSEALAKGVVLMADIKYMLKPGAITRPEDIFGTPTGEVIVGDLNDVGVLQLEKFANFEFISVVLDKIRKSIGDGFLMSHTNRREGERVTAYEIASDARALEGSLGGQYSLLAETWQKPYATIIIKEVGLTLPDNTLEPVILTGLDALARAGDLEKIRQYTEALQWPTTWPESIQAITDFTIYSREIAASLNLKQPWIKTEERLLAEAEASKKQEQENIALTEASKAIPKVIENKVGE